MSFQELVSRREEAPQVQSVKPQDPRQAVAASIFQINTSVSTFKRLANKLGTSKDTPELRQKLHKIRQQIGSLTQETSSTLKSISEIDHGNAVDRGRQIADAKLAKDFQAVLKEFQSAQRAAAHRETTHTPHIPQLESSLSGTARQLNLVEESNEEQALLIEQRRQEVLAVESERLFNEALIEERDQGIEAIQQQIGEVHEIFKDLAVLVREQGVMIDDIEANIESSHSATVESNKQLSKASKSQRSSSSLVCSLLFIFGALLVITLIVLSL
ncbi:hypothetical protein KP509_16G078800 [Ceratopteris richardii]|uniref:t-SNARE coiled-coil homology domain-containing protein n=1 Tax=Ceratopteris richardii TaxID=49495 RepID=A0A8T2T1U0_CERRI|nr:hypothetical protein KP509_16G078800 [Ceratopteris richardii]KAH7388503.1 hypothetical protein KP509_16G078800 [Ceratopteris richardii]